MRLFFDSGATKCDCILLDETGCYVRHFTARGINANYADDATIGEVLAEFAREIDEPCQGIVFSGAGCGNSQNGNRVKMLLHKYFQVENIIVESDLAGGCRLLSPGKAGMVAILGTGAAACLYDGVRIVQQVPSLGWMLGDEGSGTYLGKMFISSYLRGELSPRTITEFETGHSLERAGVLRKVYREAAPNLFFSNLAKFIHAHAASDSQVEHIIFTAFDDFFCKQISEISDYQKYPLHLMGSIAWHFRAEIENIAHNYGVEMGQVVASPLELLIREKSEKREKRE